MSGYLQIVEIPESVTDDLCIACTAGLHYVGYSRETAPKNLLESFNFDHTCPQIVDVGHMRHIIKPKAIEHKIAPDEWEVFEEPEINAALLSKIDGVLRPAFDALGAEDMRIKAANVNLCFPCFSAEPSSMIPHRDTIVKPDFFNVVLYLDDSGGDLNIYDVKDNGDTQLKLRIPHKKGRAVIFSSDMFHAGTHPEKFLRASLNLNIVSANLAKPRD